MLIVGCELVYHCHCHSCVCVFSHSLDDEVHHVGFVHVAYFPYSSSLLGLLGSLTPITGYLNRLQSPSHGPMFPKFGGLHGFVTVCGILSGALIVG